LPGQIFDKLEKKFKFGSRNFGRIFPELKVRETSRPDLTFGRQKNLSPQFDVYSNVSTEYIDMTHNFNYLNLDLIGLDYFLILEETNKMNKIPIT